MSKYKKGDRVIVTENVKFHFGYGYCEKGETGTIENVYDFGIKVAMDKGYGMWLDDRYIDHLTKGEGR